MGAWPRQARPFAIKASIGDPQAQTFEFTTQKTMYAGEFQMPWHRPGVAFTLPKNALTEKTYRGSNIVSLRIDADAKKFEHQTWATFKQWQELGAQVASSCARCSTRCRRG